MRLLFTMLMLLLAAPSLAAEPAAETQEKPAKTSYEDALLKDWIGLTKVLRTYGIHHSQIQWRPVEELCLGLMSEKEKLPYNRCRLDKAIAQFNHRNDFILCDEQSLTDYPDRLLQFSTETLVTNTNLPRGNEVATGQFIREPITARELRSKRVASFRDCMADKGWRNPDNWRQGYRN